MKTKINVRCSPSCAIIAFIFLFFTVVAMTLPVDGDSTGNTRSTALPEGYNDLFAGSGECLLCHNSMVNASGSPIGILDDWRSTMLANAGKDPLWQAKVSHEGLVNPEHKAVLEDVCTKCHMPVGHHNAHHNMQALYSLAEGQADSLALDGIQCTVCHQITAETLGNYTGNIIIGTNKKIWGQYTNPFVNPMINFTGYTPAYGQHIKDARLCGSCHTLITNSVDLNGVPTGEAFVEQALYHEWENSIFPADGISCQTCHIPSIDDLVKISTLPWWLDSRSPFGKHHFAGANVFMTTLLRDFADEIGVTATSAQFDSTLNRSQKMLKHTLQLTLEELHRSPDTLSVKLRLQNLAGHKFPSGFPSRRAYVQLVALSENGDTLFISGETDDDFNLLYENETFENHQQVINSEEQVQIYEMIMGDVNGNVTTVLERAYVPLKDNRLPPMGFTSAHPNYDTVKIVGLAQNDPDFNIENSAEGSGSDEIHFNISTSGYAGEITISASIRYQTVSDKWLQEAFAFSSDEIDAFKLYYEGADKTPYPVAETSITSGPRIYAYLDAGWNSLSSFIVPPNTDMEMVLASVFNSVEIVTGDEGIFYPSGGIYTLNDFNPYHGYAIKMKNAELLEIAGVYSTEQTIQLNEGWNILPVISPCSTEINSLSGSFTEKLEAIVELIGWSVYWPEKDIFSLQKLDPGKAYLVKLSGSCEVIFPLCP